MKRKQRKSLPWRRFRYVILVIIKFCELLLWIPPRIINALRSYIKHSKYCLIRYPNTSKLVKKNSAVPRFFNPLLSVWISDETLFLVFDILLNLHAAFCDCLDLVLWQFWFTLEWDELHIYVFLLAIRLILGYYWVYKFAFYSGLLN